MAIGSVVTRGYGSGGSSALVALRGYTASIPVAYATSTTQVKGYDATRTSVDGFGSWLAVKGYDATPLTAVTGFGSHGAAKGYDASRQAVTGDGN